MALVASTSAINVQDHTALWVFTRKTWENSPQGAGGDQGVSGVSDVPGRWVGASPHLHATVFARHNHSENVLAISALVPVTRAHSRKSARMHPRNARFSSNCARAGKARSKPRIIQTVNCPSFHTTLRLDATGSIARSESSRALCGASELKPACSLLQSLEAWDRPEVGVHILELERGA